MLTLYCVWADTVFLPLAHQLSFAGRVRTAGRLRARRVGGHGRGYGKQQGRQRRVFAVSIVSAGGGGGGDGGGGVDGGRKRPRGLWRRAGRRRGLPDANYLRRAVHAGFVGRRAARQRVAAARRPALAFAARNARGGLAPVHCGRVYRPTARVHVAERQHRGAERPAAGLRTCRHERCPDQRLGGGRWCR